MDRGEKKRERIITKCKILNSKNNPLLVVYLIRRLGKKRGGLVMFGGNQEKWRETTRKIGDSRRERTVRRLEKATGSNYRFKGRI